MFAQCNRESFGFHALGRRDVVARFDGGLISSDAGGLLLRETERITGVIGQFAACFTDLESTEFPPTSCPSFSQFSWPAVSARFPDRPIGRSGV